MQCEVPDPDDVDLWLHNHQVLQKLSWASLVWMGIMIYENKPYAVAALIFLFLSLRLMSRLLCGWVHSWAAHEIHAVREKLKEH